MYKLVISDDEGKTTVVPLVRDEISIGRKEGNTIRLTERNVSRKHAKLSKANGAFTVEDLQSYNGTKVNGRRIDGLAHLAAGDQIGIGDYLLAVQLDAADTAGATTAAVPAPGGSDAATAMIAAPASPPPPARLVMLTPPAPGAEFALSKPVMRIGRAEDLDAWVNHRSISREHAEVVQDGDRYKLVDLGSANGVRLNGQEVSAAPLSPGDVVELGQVRFRFVGPGEHYVFDTDRTVQMEAIASEGGMPKAPLFGAIGILGVAVVVAAVFALGGEDDDQRPSIVVDTPGSARGGAEGAVAPTAPMADVAEDVQACQRALESGDVTQALVHAGVALRLDPNHSAARACRAAAEAQQVEGRAFEDAMTHFRAGRLDEAILAVGSLPAASPLRSRPEVARIRDGFVTHHLQLAQRGVRRDPTAALAHADAVLGIEELSAAQRAQAQALRGEAEQALGSVAAAAPPDRRVPAPPDRRGGARGPRDSVRPGGGGGGAAQGGGGSTTAAAGGGATTQAGGGTTAAAAAGGGATPPREECNPAAPSYGQCIIRTLEGRARTADDLNKLIAAYRQSGNMPAALRHMTTFVQRFPTNSRANQYRQILRAHGHEVP